MSKLEKAIISSLNRYLKEIRHYVSNDIEASGAKELAEEIGESEDDVLRNQVSNAFIALTALTELAHIQDSGLSEQSYQEILAIEKEANRLIRTFGWMYG